MKLRLPLAVVSPRRARRRWPALRSRMPSSARPSRSPKAGQLFTLAVPTEKEDATTTKVVLTVPDGFSIDSFVAAPGLEARGASRPARARTP